MKYDITCAKCGSHRVRAVITDDLICEGFWYAGKNPKLIDVDLDIECENCGSKVLQFTEFHGGE